MPVLKGGKGILFSIGIFIALGLLIEGGSWLSLQLPGRNNSLIAPAFVFKSSKKLPDPCRFCLPSSIANRATHNSASGGSPPVSRVYNVPISGFIQGLEVPTSGKNNPPSHVGPDEILRLVDYELDSHIRRLVPHPAPGPNSYHFLTIGCSQTFGWGLEASETLAAQFASFHPSSVPLILAQGAGNPASILGWVRKLGALDGIEPRRGIAVFRLFDFHFARLLLNYYGQDFPHRARAVYGKDGKIDVSQTFEENPTSRGRFLRLIWGLNFSRATRITPPIVVDDADMNLMADTIEALKEEYLNRTSRENTFVVLIQPGVSYESLKPFLPYLEERGIFYLDYQSVHEHMLSEQPIYQGRFDSHYNANYNRISAEILGDDLKPFLRELE